MEEVTKECVHAFRTGDKENALKLLPKLYQPETIRDPDEHSLTLVHHAAQRGWDDICKLLIEEYHCDPSATNKGGFTPLHWVCMWGGGVQAVKYLLSLPSVIRSINNKNSLGITALDHACHFANLPIVEILLSVPSISIPIESLPSYKYAVLSLIATRIDWSSEVTVRPYFNVFMLGNSGAGKSTLAAVMVELARGSPSQHGYISGIKKFTAGIIPTQCTGVFQLREDKKLLGLVHYDSRVTGIIELDTSVEIYDMSGQADYYSSHAAVLESLCLESPAVFVMMVDLSKDKEQLRKEIYYWSNFLEIQSSSILSHVIVVGSRKDKLYLEPQLLTSKCMYVESITKKALEKQHFAGFVALDSRQLSSENVLPFLTILAKSVNEVIDPGVHEKISFTCLLLHKFLREIVKVNAISLDCLQRRVYSDSTLSPLSDLEKLTSSLVILANKGFILFLRNTNHFSSSCIVIDKMKLLQEINGALFAPTSFKEHLPIASNRGIVPVTLLHQSFPHYGHEILVAMMTALQFCHPINPESATSEQLLYFPALVSAKRPDHLSISDGFGWCMYCTNRHKFLTRRFFDTLMLDLADKFCLSFPPLLDVEEANEAVIHELSRDCTVWTNGIYWKTNDGIQAMVQITEENRCVSLSLSLDQKHTIEWLELHSSVINTIYSKLKKLCSSIDVSEYLISSSQLPQISHSNLSQLTVFEMKDIARTILLEDSFVFDVMGKERISPASLLFSDPYCVLPPTVVQQLFSSNKSSEPVPPRLLKEIRRHIKEILIPENSTLVSVRERLNKLSVFAGRNPLELAGVTAADLPSLLAPSVDCTDLPAIAVFHSYYDRLAKGVRDPVSLASKLYSKQLLSREERDQVVTPQNATPLHRSMTLLEAVESRIEAEGSSRPLTILCQALEEIPGLSVVAAKLRMSLVGLDLWCPSDSDSTTHSYLDKLAGVSDSDPPPDSSTDILPEGPLDSSHLSDLLVCLHDLQDWKKLGVFLGVSYPTLQKIDRDERGVDDCKIAMLYHWLCSGTANKQTLLTALKRMDAGIEIDVHHEVMESLYTLGVKHTEFVIAMKKKFEEKYSHQSLHTLKKFLAEVFDNHSFENCLNVQEIFNLLTTYISVFNIYMLKVLSRYLNIKGADKLVREYEKECDSFLSSTSVESFKQVIHNRLLPPCPEGKQRITLKLLNSWPGRTLKDLEHLVYSVFGVHGRALVCISATPGSILVSWLVPDSVAPILIMKVMESRKLLTVEDIGMVLVQVHAPIICQKDKQFSLPESTCKHREHIKETQLLKSQVQSLENELTELKKINSKLGLDLDNTKAQLHSSKSLELCSSVIAMIRSKQKELCSSIDVSEYLISLSELSSISHTNLSCLTVFAMKDVAKSALLKKTFVFSVDQKKNSLESLLFSDPYQVLPPTVVQQLFASEKSLEPVPASLLKEICHHIKVISIPETPTHKDVRDQLNKFSVFAGKNPLMLAGLTAADFRHSLLSDVMKDTAPTNTLPSSSDFPDLPGMEVFRRYHDRLANSVRDPVSLAKKLFGKEILSEEERDQVVTPQNATSQHLTTILLEAVEKRMKTEQSLRPLAVICEALENFPEASDIVKEIRKDL